MTLKRHFLKARSMGKIRNRIIVTKKKRSVVSISTNEKNKNKKSPACKILHGFH